MCMASGNWVYPRKKEILVFALEYLLIEWMSSNITVLVQASIREHHRLGSLSNKHISHSPKNGEVSYQGATVVRFWWGPSSRFPHMMAKETAQISLSPFKGSNLTVGAPSPCPHPNLITSQRPHLHIQSHWVLRLQLQHMNLAWQGEQGTNFAFIEIICIISSYFPPDSAKHVYLKLDMNNKYI